jgi:hydrogenase maturation protease
MNYLVIGYGNSLRGDDGVGRQVAEQVAAWNLPQVSSLSVHQLTPELAELIAHTDVVLFVDASLRDGNQTEAQIERLQATDLHLPSDHLWTANGLLQLAQLLYGASPVAYQIWIPARQFDYGTTLSATTREGLNWAVAKIGEVINHLGLIAGIIDDTGIEEIINEITVPHCPFPVPSPEGR